LKPLWPWSESALVPPGLRTTDAQTHLRVDLLEMRGLEGVKKSSAACARLPDGENARGQTPLRCTVTRMEQRYLGLVALAIVACGGPSYGSGSGVKTPDQLVADQEQLGDQQLKNESSSAHVDTEGSTEDEKIREWDDKQADLELKRAAHSAETCPDSVTEKDPKAKNKTKEGKARVTVLFANDGHVKSLTTSPPYDQNPVGKCVQRALNAVIVPAFKGPEHTLEWEIDLTGAKKSGPVGGDQSDSAEK
jgi:hypothetical protein